jgi:hypothetical protein
VHCGLARPARRERCDCPAQLDPAIHRLEQRGWVTLTSRGALLGDQREYGLSLTSEAKLALEDVASGGQSEEP